MTVTLNEGQVSDLFFNFEKPNFDSVDRLDESLSDEEIAANERAALLEDAKFFSEIVGGQVTPQQLAEDFMARV